MSIWSPITGVFQPVKELVEVFKPNAETEAERGHKERMEINRQDLASMQQFADEFKSSAPRPPGTAS